MLSFRPAEIAQDSTGVHKGWPTSLVIGVSFLVVDEHTGRWADQTEPPQTTIRRSPL